MWNVWSMKDRSLLVGQKLGLIKYTASPTTQGDWQNTAKNSTVWRVRIARMESALWTNAVWKKQLGTGILPKSINAGNSRAEYNGHVRESKMQVI